MFTGLNVFKMAHAMATHAGHRQALTAQNLANSDTPGYKARDIASFASSYRADDPGGMRASRAGHLNAPSSDGMRYEELTPDTPADPNGNSVSVELEILRSVEAKRQHDRAIAIYKSSLTVLRTSLGRG